MRLAHLSDFHIGRTGVERDRDRALALVDRALASGVEHMVFSGDLVDHGNIEDLVPLVRHLDRRRMLAPERLTVVPGNHDIWPFGERDPLGDVFRWAKSNWQTLRALEPDFAAQRRFDRFVELFGPAYEGVRCRRNGARFPAVKQVGRVALALLDTTADRALRHAQGQLDAGDARWVVSALERCDGPKLLVMHHWPFAWSTAEPDEITDRIPAWLRAGFSVVGVDADDVARDLVDVNFRDLRAVRRLVKTRGSTRCSAGICTSATAAHATPGSTGSSAACPCTAWVGRGRFTRTSRGRSRSTSSRSVSA